MFNLIQLFAHIASARALNPIRKWLDSVEIENPQVAQIICRLIPANCPFARTVKFGNRVLFTIPPLCKLNPFYDQFVGLRFRSLICLDAASHPTSR